MHKIILAFICSIYFICVYGQNNESNMEEMRNSIRIDTNQNFRKDLREITDGHFGQDILKNQRDDKTGLEI